MGTIKEGSFNYMDKDHFSDIKAGMRKVTERHLAKAKRQQAKLAERLEKTDKAITVIDRQIKSLQNQETVLHGRRIGAGIRKKKIQERISDLDRKINEMPLLTINDNPHSPFDAKLILEEQKAPRKAIVVPTSN